MKNKAQNWIVGIDEVGRGPIAGPICIGLVVMREKNHKLLKGIKDSKKLSLKSREDWFKKIKELKKDGLLDFSYSMISSHVIDKKGIVFAINLAIARITNTMIYHSVSNVKILLDGGLKAPERYKNQETIIKGDEKIAVISAASVVAKVTRDKLMIAFARKYPEYGFERHKGYGTKEHYKKIKKYGSTELHRGSFLKE
jgi:ribonuclease HII